MGRASQYYGRRRQSYLKSWSRNQNAVLTSLHVPRQVTKTAASEADQICYVAGRYSKDSEEWSLAVPSEPAMGVKLTYYGDYCANDPSTWSIT